MNIQSRKYNKVQTVRKSYIEWKSRTQIRDYARTLEKTRDVMLTRRLI